MSPKDQKRVVVYVNEKDARLLKARLAERGLTISEWVRQMVKNFVNRQ